MCFLNFEFKNIFKFDEYINLINTTRYGLKNYFFSSSKFWTKKLTTRVQSERIWVNSSLKWKRLYLLVVIIYLEIEEIWVNLDSKIF